MNQLTKLTIRKIFTSLTFSALCVQMFAFGISAQTIKSRIKQTDETAKPEISIPTAIYKIAPDLEEKTNNLMFGRQSDEIQRVIIQIKSETPLNEMFGNSLSAADQKSLVAREVTNTKQKAGILLTDLVQINGRLKKSFNNLGLVSAELPLSKVRELSQNENVAYISPDREIQSNGHIGSTTGWYNSGISDANDADPTTWLDGGYGSIAVIDSGID